MTATSGIRREHHALVRRTNEATVLSAIIEHSPISRSKLMEITGLSKPTVLAIVAALRQRELIRPVPASSAGAGRPADYYEANPRAGFAIGIDLGGTKVRAALCDLVGDIIAEVVEPTVRAGGVGVIDQMVRLSRALAKSARVPWRSVCSVAIGCPGFVTEDGTLTAAVNIPGFDALAPKRLLERALRVPVFIENDVNTAAYGEFAARSFGPVRSLVVISIGTGVGAGIIIDGHILRGATGAAGEIAYLPLGGDPSTHKARRRGSLELSASGPGMQRSLRAHIAEGGPASCLGPDASPEAIFAAAADGDLLGRLLVDEEAALIARAILTVDVVCDPEVFVLAGGIGSNEVLLEPVRDALRQIAPFPIRVERSASGDRSGLLGATALARRRGWRMLFPPDAP